MRVRRRGRAGGGHLRWRGRGPHGEGGHGYDTCGHPGRRAGRRRGEDRHGYLDGAARKCPPALAADPGCARGHTGRAAGRRQWRAISAADRSAEPRRHLVRCVRGGHGAHHERERHGLPDRVARRARDGQRDRWLPLSARAAESASVGVAAVICRKGGEEGRLLRWQSVWRDDGLVDAYGQTPHPQRQHPPCVSRARRLGCLRLHSRHDGS